MVWAACGFACREAASGLETNCPYHHLAALGAGGFTPLGEPGDGACGNSRRANSDRTPGIQNTNDTSDRNRNPFDNARVASAPVATPPAAGIDGTVADLSGASVTWLSASSAT